jgi:hypothetical protein
MARLEKWHKKELSEDQHDMFFRLLETIKDVAFPDIVEKWVKYSKPMPGHFPTVNDILELWYSWQQDHSELFEPGTRPGCDQCLGRGWLWFKKPDPENDIAYEHIIGCATCYGFKIDIGPGRRIPVSTRAKLEDQEYMVWPYSTDKGAQMRGKFKNINELAATVGHEDDIPF